MPYRVTRMKNGKVRVKNKSTGKARTFKSKRAFQHWKRVAEAVQHGFKPKGE